MIEIIDVSKQYSGCIALESISCTIQEGEFVSFLGPSGSGKSTLLNIIAGILPQSSGKILFNDTEDCNLLPKMRNIGYVFQNYALYPHMTVMNNILFPLESLGYPREVRFALVKKIASVVEIEHLLHKKPNELSGGEQQRVAIARALVKQPKLLLMDEPFSNLDPHLATQMRSEIKKLQSDLGITTIMVTHNQAEAMELSDRIGVLSHGRLVQYDTTYSIYQNPTSLFCAQFVGDVQINAFYGLFREKQFIEENESLVIPVRDEVSGRAVACVRPENISNISRSINGELAVVGKIIAVFNRGREMLISVLVGNIHVRYLVSSKEQKPKIGQCVSLYFDKKSVLFFDLDSGKRIEIML